MNKILIDTHTFLWYMEGSNLISKEAILLINNTSTVFLSIISLWEIAIKQNIGKLELKYSLEKYINHWKAMNGKTIYLTEKNVFEYKKLELHHRDPFDRMLIARAITENIPIISADTKFDLYPEIQRIW
jgi:PIN domain nuclease of toxin-antitoxin system